MHGEEIARLLRLRVIATFLAPLFCRSLSAQDLPVARQYFQAGPVVLAGAIQVPATPVPKVSGSILVIFRRGAAGRVIDAQAAGGSAEMQQSALTSIRQWHFNSPMINGAPPEIVNAAIFVFADGAVSVGPSPMMTANQLSPRLGFECPNALAHHAVGTEVCQHQLHDVQISSASTDVERFIAHDEYGLALLDAHQPQPALVEFSEAVRLAVQVMKPSDPELAYIYLHRAAAEAQNADPTTSEQDRAMANNLLDALASDSSGPAQAYYKQLKGQFASPFSVTMAH